MKGNKIMYFSEMTSGARRTFIKFIIEYAERDNNAVEMVKKFVNDEWSTEEIENKIYC